MTKPFLRSRLHTVARFSVVVAFATVLPVFVASTATAQNTTADEDRERLTAERFMQVLLKRPRLGTSLDRVYGYHVRSGSLNALLTALENPTSKQAEDFNLKDANQGSAMMVLGMLQLQRGKSAKAVIALKKAEKLLPEDAVCSHYLGRAHLAIGETELAAAAMERAIQRQPARNEALPIFTELGRIYGRAGAVDKALSVWNRLEEQFPGDSRVSGQIATTLADEGNLPEALKRFEALAKSARKDEDKISFAIQAAEVKRRLGESKQATADLENILGQLRPGSWLYTDVRNRIEDGFLKSGDIDGLADYYQGRLSKDKDNLELMVRLGRILVSASRLEEASKVLTNAVERAPEDVNVRLGLVDVLVRQTQIAEAGKQYEQLAKQDPANPDYLLKWGQLLLEDQSVELAERRTAAAAIWQRLADARSDDAVTLAQVADRLRSVKQTENAIALYRKAIELAPTAPQYREYLGEYFHQLDRKDEAIETWESIADGNRRQLDSLIRLAEIYSTFKLTERSLETWKAAAEFDLSFSQELRYSNQLRTASVFDEALKRLALAEKMAETPSERDQVLSDRIKTYSEAGTLASKITALEKVAPTSINEIKELALMYQAAGQPTDAFVTIQQALTKQPKNIGVLAIAADILEKQNRFADAVKYYRQLASTDRRFQTNYLEKVAQLQVRLGLGKDALKTSEELIQTNPASTSTYLFAARTAMQLGRTDEGMEILRRAMSVARRDNGPRKMLAAEFAKQYRTDEAIDLYWQALDFESKLDNRIDIIRRLAPLYERRAEIETLLSRIEELSAKDNDIRSTQLLIAAANEAVQDYGSARQAIDRLLAMQPRNVDLLETMVRLCDAANELELAIEFQQRIVTLADTPQNRFRLLNLQLDAGTIDFNTALSKQVSMAKDPSRLMSMIQSAIRKGDSQTAITIAQQALKADDSLWDIKLVLAQVLLHQPQEGFNGTSDGQKPDGKEADTNSGTTKPKHPWNQALDLCEQIAAAKGSWNESLPTASTRQQGTGSANPPNRTLSPSQWGQSSYKIARAYQLADYGQQFYWNQQGISLIESVNLGHAKVIAKALTWVPQARTTPPEEFVTFLKKDFEPLALPKDLNQITDVNRFWKAKALQSYGNQMVKKKVVLDPESRKHPGTRYTEITFRIFELDPKAGFQGVRSKLNTRLQQTTAFRKWQFATNNGSKSNDGKAIKKPKKGIPKPLTESQLQQLISHYDQQVKQIRQSAKRSKIELLDFSAGLRNELELAGKAELAKQYAEIQLAEDALFRHIVAMIQFHQKSGKIDQADKLVSRLLPAVREAKERAAQVQGLRHQYSTGSWQTFQTGSSGPDFIKRHRFDLLDVIIAVNRQNHALQTRRTSSVSTGSFTIYKHTQNQGNRSVEVKAPLSLELIDQTLAQEIIAIEGIVADKPSSSQVIQIDEDYLQHLTKPIAGAPASEIKSRNTLAAFAYWWMNQPQKCYNILARLSKQYPDDVNLRIEHARLASELGNDREALDILNDFEPLDSKMLVRKEMAALNLAARINDEERAAQAAERLFGMRIDTRTQLALSEQLRQLGMKDKAAAVLQRLKGGRKQDDSTKIQIAESLIEAGDKDAAAEVAFQLFRSVNRNRSQQGNNEYYRKRAISLLKSADRLAPLVAMAKRRFDAAPKSATARKELIELYIAAGKKKAADKLLAEMPKSKSSRPTDLIQQAKQLAQTGKNKEAVPLMLKALQQEPRLLEQNFYDLQRQVREAKAWDEMYTGLLKIPANRISEYRIDEILRGDYRQQSEAMSDAQLKFAIHVLEAGVAKYALYSIMSKVTDKQKEQYPKFRKAIIKMVTDDSVFQLNTNTWTIHSYSGNGNADGAVKPVIEFLAQDKEAQTAFEKAVKKQLSKTKNGEAYLARMLQALVKLKSGALNKDQEQIKATANEVRILLDEMKNSEARKQSGSNQAGWNGYLPSTFLWQAGTIIQTVNGIPDKPKFLLAVYESAKITDSQVNDQDPRYSIIHPLVQVYKGAGKPERAVNLLMNAYQNLDFSEHNQYNPGYSDYQDLQSWNWIAEQLQSCNAPFHALAIYRRALAAPSKFEKSQRWGSSMKVDQFKVGAKKAAASINGPTAIQFLKNQLATDDAEPKSLKEFDLQLLPIRAFEDQQIIPSFLMAMNEAKKSDEGIKQLNELLTGVSQQQDQEGKVHWSNIGVQLMIASVVKPEKVKDLTDTLFTHLPSQAQIQDNPTQQLPYLDCFTVAMALSQSDHADAKTAVKKIAALLTAITTKTSQTNAMLVVEQRFGDPEQAVIRLLTEIESKNIGKAPLKDQVTVALKIASTLAKQNDWKGSARAFKAALGQGPPLVGISKATSVDAFAINNNQSSYNPSSTTNQASLTDAEVLQLLKTYEDHLQLQHMGNQSPGTNQVTAEVRQDADYIFEALLQVVIPQSQSPKVVLYGEEIASSTGYDNSSNTLRNSQVNSAIKTLTKVALLTNRFDDVHHRLTERITAPTVESTTLQIHLALQKKNGTELTKAINLLESVLDKTLPSADAKTVNSNRSISITSQMQAASFEKSRVLNQILHAVWDVAKQDDLAGSPAATSTDRILARTMALIGSDVYTMQRHSQINQTLKDPLAKKSASNGRQSLFSSVIQGMARAIENQHATNHAVAAAEAQKKSLQPVLNSLIQTGNLKTSHGLVRQVIESEKQIRRDYTSVDATNAMQAIAKLPPDQQYDLLLKITLGDRKDAPVLHWMGFVRASEVPELVRQQTPHFGMHKAIPVCSDMVPIADTALMLTQVAAELGKTDALVKTLKSRSKQKLDTADQISMLARLAANGESAVPEMSEALKALVDRLRQNRPATDDRKIQIPELELVLISQVIKAGETSKFVDEFLTELRHFAIRAHQYQIISALGILRGSTNFGPTAGASVSSPLQHFISMSVPSSTDVEAANLRPMHAINSEGWVSSTGGYNVNLLLLKYPVTGSFTMTAEIKDGWWAESDVSYGGVLYQPNGWNKLALIRVLRGGKPIPVPVKNAKFGDVDTETLKITPDKTQGLCNGEVYAQDRSTSSYPWPAVSQHFYRTSQWKNFKITGNPVIPRQVHLLDSTLRGWTALGNNHLLPPHLLLAKEGKQASKSANSVNSKTYLFKDGELIFNAKKLSGHFDQGGQMQYLRPLLDGEELTWKFFWKQGESEVHPMIGRTTFVLSDQGTQPSYTAVATDLSTIKLIKAADTQERPSSLAPKVSPQNDAWNTIKMVRRGDVIQLHLNGQKVVELPVTNQTAKIGFSRDADRNCRIKDMILTGDWPETLPNNLMQRAE